MFDYLKTKGVIIMSKVNGFNGDNNCKQRVEIHTEKTSGGTKITKSIFMQSEDGKSEYLAREEEMFDNNNDGVIDELIIKIRDKKGQLVEKQKDYDGDGKIDYVIFVPLWWYMYCI